MSDAPAASQTQSRGERWLSWIANSVVVALWLATFAVMIAWALRLELPFDAEPVAGLLTMCSAGFTTLVSLYARALRQKQAALEDEQYSTPLALAYGYVNNFVEPAVTKLLSEADPARGPLRFYVFVPDKLADLEPDARDRILSRIREKQFRSDVIKLELKAGRARDLLTIMKTGGARPMYFDFPSTLLTLKSLVDYKVESGKDQFDDAAKLALGRQYIAKFVAHTRRLIAEKDLTPYVWFTDKTLAFLDQAA